MYAYFIHRITKKAGKNFVKAKISIKFVQN